MTVKLRKRKGLWDGSWDGIGLSGEPVLVRTRTGFDHTVVYTLARKRVRCKRKCGNGTNLTKKWYLDVPSRWNLYHIYTISPTMSLIGCRKAPQFSSL